MPVHPFWCRRNALWLNCFLLLATSFLFFLFTVDQQWLQRYDDEQQQRSVFPVQGVPPPSRMDAAIGVNSNNEVTLNEEEENQEEQQQNITRKMLQPHWVLRPTPLPPPASQQNADKKFEWQLKDNEGKEVSIVELLLPPESTATLQERVTMTGDPTKEQSLLLMWDLPFSDTNLRGCPEWNCKVTRDKTKLPDAAAVFFGSAHSELERRPGQYFVFYSQESPLNNPSGSAPPNFFNMSFGYRMDTPGASPYGFAARLAVKSRPGPELFRSLEKMVAKKKKAVAWLVSHCGTPSGREWIAKQMQKHIQVDIYGSCGPLRCPRGTNCKKMLNEDYFFYFATENSICKDYLTEKIWDQGLDTNSVPIVLRRSLVKHLLPPNSFIAVDDYKNTEQLAAHLNRLMVDTTEYLRYFEWRAEYVAVKLNGDTDPRGEKLFGVCQVCRLTQMRNAQTNVPIRPPVQLPAPMRQWWDGSCERAIKLVNELKS